MGLAISFASTVKEKVCIVNFESVVFFFFIFYIFHSKVVLLYEMLFLYVLCLYIKVLAKPIWLISVSVAFSQTSADVA